MVAHRRDVRETHRRVARAPAGPDRRRFLAGSALLLGAAAGLAAAATKARGAEPADPRTPQPSHAFTADELTEHRRHYYRRARF